MCLLCLFVIVDVYTLCCHQPNLFPPTPKVCFCLTRAQMSIKLTLSQPKPYVSSSSSSSSLSHTYTQSITSTLSLFPSYLIADNLCLLSGCRSRPHPRARSHSLPPSLSLTHTVRA